MCEWQPAYELPETMENSEISERDLVQHNVALTAILSLVSNFCEHSQIFDYILSSLDDNLFDEYSTSSGRRIIHIPLPLISASDSSRIFFHALGHPFYLDPHKEFRPEVCERFLVLSKFVGQLPRHVSACAKVLNRDKNGYGKFVKFTANENTLQLLSFVCDEIEDLSLLLYPELPLILCHVVLVILSDRFKQPVHLCEMFKGINGKALNISHKQLVNYGILAASRNDGSACLLSPCFLTIILLFKCSEILKSYNIHRLLTEMCQLDLFCVDGIKNEKFHILWVRVKLCILRILHNLRDPIGKLEVSLYELYNFSGPPLPLVGFPPTNLITNKELHKIMISTSSSTKGVESFVINPNEYEKWFAADGQDIPFAVCSAGQMAFECAHRCMIGNVKCLLLIQDKVSQQTATTKYSITDIANCCKAIAGMPEITKLQQSGVKIVVIWAALRDHSLPQVKAQQMVAQMMQKQNISFLVLPNNHMRNLYFNFIKEPSPIYTKKK